MPNELPPLHCQRTRILPVNPHGDSIQGGLNFMEIMWCCFVKGVCYSSFSLLIPSSNISQFVSNEQFVSNVWWSYGITPHQISSSIKGFIQRHPTVKILSLYCIKPQSLYSCLWARWTCGDCKDRKALKLVMRYTRSWYLDSSHCCKDRMALKLVVRHIWSWDFDCRNYWKRMSQNVTCFLVTPSSIYKHTLL